MDNTSFLDFLKENLGDIEKLILNNINRIRSSTKLWGRKQNPRIENANESVTIKKSLQ